MNRLAMGLMLGVMMLLVVPASEATVFRAVLSGPNESPANSSPGVGFATVDFNVTTHMMHVTASFNGLTTGTTASHIHCCIIVPNGTAGVATTTPTFAGFPLGVTSGTYDNTLDTTQASSWNPAYITANGGTPASAEAALFAGMTSGLAYFNIHTTQFPGGEIRGFLAADLPIPNLPALSEWALVALAAALALVAFIVMRRRAG